jgi:hypothetical protein
MDNTTLRYQLPGRRGLTVHLVLSLTGPGAPTAVDPASLPGENRARSHTGQAQSWIVSRLHTGLLRRMT